MCELLSMNNYKLRTILKETKKNIYLEKGYNDEGLLEDKIKKLILLNKNDNIEELFLCHLCRQIEIPNTLLPLDTLLTTDNSLSEYLNVNFK